MSSSFVNIPFLHAGEDCEDCTKALKKIESAIEQCPDIPCKIDLIESHLNRAIETAIEKGIDTLPGFVIGEKVFNGKDDSEEEIIEAIKETWNQNQ